MTPEEPPGQGHRVEQDQAPVPIGALAPKELPTNRSTADRLAEWSAHRVTANQSRVSSRH